MRQEKEWVQPDQYLDADIKHKFDFSDSVAQKGSNVSTVTLTSTGKVTVTVASEALASNVWTGVVTGDTKGQAQAMLDLTYADATTDKRFFRFNIIDPRLTIQ